MANYVSLSSDKTKAGARRRLLLGGIGLQYFYVGRLKVGFIRLLIGVLLWSLVIAGFAEHEKAMTVSGIVALVVINLVELAIIGLGRFRDNTGAFLRQ